MRVTWTDTRFLTYESPTDRALPRSPGIALSSTWALLARRKWPIVATLLILVVGTAFMLFWNPVVSGQPTWYTGNDLWGIFRGAHYVSWGYLGGMYSPGTGVLAFPGIAIILAPVALASSHFHLTESYPPIFLDRPTAALVLQPVELLLAATVVFATDALGEFLEVAPRRRVALCVSVAAIAWPVAAIWGHAEDMLALSFGAWSMLAMFKQRWSRAGWLLGLGILMQPLIALLLPLIIATTPAGKRILMIYRSLALSVLLVGVAAIGNPSGTYQSLFQQPAFPTFNHATPWASLAPILTRASSVATHRADVTKRFGHLVFTNVNSIVHTPGSIAGGPGRSIDLVLALLIGAYVWRRPQGPLQLLWLALVVLASRCFFEAVMTPYYLAPPLILGLVLASCQGARRFWSATVISLGVTVFAYHFLSPWAWWLPVVAGLGAVVALGYPGGVWSSGKPMTRGEDAGHADLVSAAD